MTIRLEHWIPDATLEGEIVVGSESPLRRASDAVAVVEARDILRLASFLGWRYGCSGILNLGSGELRPLISPEAPGQKVGIGPPELVRLANDPLWSSGLRDREFSGKPRGPVDVDLIKRSVLTGSSTVNVGMEAPSLFRELNEFLNYSPVGLFAFAATEPGDGVSRPDPVRSLREWQARLQAEGLNCPFAGFAPVVLDDGGQRSVLAVLENNHFARPGPAPADFRVVAILTAYNEEDVIVPAIQRLVGQEIGVFVIDNWSSDGTFELARRYLGRGVIGVERFPASGPVHRFLWGQLLQRVEEVSRSLKADWFIHHDVDEERESPWPGVTCGTALRMRTGWGLTVSTTPSSCSIPSITAIGRERHWGTIFSISSSIRRPNRSCE